MSREREERDWVDVRGDGDEEEGTERRESKEEGAKVDDLESPERGDVARFVSRLLGVLVLVSLRAEGGLRGLSSSDQKPASSPSDPDSS